MSDPNPFADALQIPADPLLTDELAREEVAEMANLTAAQNLRRV